MIGFSFNDFRRKRFVAFLRAKISIFQSGCKVEVRNRRKGRRGRARGSGRAGELKSEFRVKSIRFSCCVFFLLSFSFLIALKCQSVADKSTDLISNFLPDKWEENSKKLIMASSLFPSWNWWAQGESFSGRTDRTFGKSILFFFLVSLSVLLPACLFVCLSVRLPLSLSLYCFSLSVRYKYVKEITSIFF